MNADFQKITISSYFFRRRLKKLTRLFYVFVMLTILFTAYLYGMIEIDSQKVVFKILPSSFNSHGSGRGHFNKKVNNIQDRDHNHNRQSSTSEDNSGHAVAIRHNPSNNEANSNNNNKNFQMNRMDSNSLNKNRNHKKMHQNKLQHMSVERNISKLFASLERYSLQITTLLRPYEASNVADLKEKFELQAKERKLKVKEEFNKLKVKENNKQNEARDDKTPAVPAVNETAASDASYGDLNLVSDIASHEIITRELMVRFLRYENFVLKKMPSKSIVTIKTLLNQYDSNKELDIK